MWQKIAAQNCNNDDTFDKNRKENIRRLLNKENLEFLSASFLFVLVSYFLRCLLLYESEDRV